MIPAQEAAQAAAEAAQAAAAAQAAQATVSAPGAAQPASYTGSDNAAMDFIFSHESGNRPGIANSEGCIGLGQACPASKLIAACPNWASDVPCQIAFFTAYANARYGGWGPAAAYWSVHRNW